MIFVPYFVGVRSRERARLAEAEVLEPPLPETTPQARLSVLYTELARRVAASPEPRAQVGDCTATIGMAAGLQAKGLEPTIVWLDAHGDFNTWETSPSGFLGGMPLAMIVGWGEQTIVEGAGLRPISPDRVLLAGARDLDPGEVTNLETAGVRRVGVEELLQGSLPEGPIYLHLDPDVVRLEEMPAVNYPAPGGPSADTVRRALERVFATGRVAAFSLACWDPDRPGARISAATADRLARGLLYPAR